MTFYSPINQPYTISAFFGDQMWYGVHRGVDITVDPKIEYVAVVAPVTGSVVQAGWHYQFGRHVRIRGEDGSLHILGHLRLNGGILVALGEHVRVGQQVGIMGNSGWSRGRHTHWQVYDVYGTLLNPLTYLSNDTMANIITRITAAAVEKFKNPKSVYIIVPGDGEYLVIDSKKRKIKSRTKTKDLEALKNIFGVFVSAEDASKIEDGPDL